MPELLELADLFTGSTNRVSSQLKSYTRVLSSSTVLRSVYEEKMRNSTIALNFMTCKQKSTHFIANLTSWTLLSSTGTDLLLFWAPTSIVGMYLHVSEISGMCDVLKCTYPITEDQQHLRQSRPSNNDEIKQLVCTLTLFGYVSQYHKSQNMLLCCSTHRLYSGKQRHSPYLATSRLLRNLHFDTCPEWRKSTEAKN